MKSTGEVLGIGKTLEEALFKGLIAAGYQMSKRGGVLITVKDTDKAEIAEIGRKYAGLGFRLYATKGTAETLRLAGLQVDEVKKIHESDDNTRTLLESGRVSYIISTSSKGRLPTLDSVKLRRKAVELGIPCLTSLDTASALADSLMSRYTPYSTELVDLNRMRKERQKLRFTKLQSCGNDYLYFNCFDQQVESPESLSVTLSNRHYGIGADGVILILPSKTADACMRLFNLDGSEGKMGGNGLRCVAKYLYETGMVKKTVMEIETLSGIKKARLYVQNGRVQSVAVSMGKAELSPAKIPVKLPGDRVVNRLVEIGGGAHAITCVSMGNPHCVVFCDNLDSLDIEQVGRQFEHADIFPERVNTEFVQVIDRATIKMRVWERGSGETFACGTGACAAAVAAILCGYCKPDVDVLVKLKGGSLSVRYQDGDVTMTGDAVKVYDGEVEI